MNFRPTLRSKFLAVKFLAVVAFLLIFCLAPAQDQCEAILRVVLEQTSTTDETQLDHQAFTYYSSDGFREDFKRGAFRGGVSIGPLSLQAGANDETIRRWQESIKSISRQKLTATSRRTFLESKGLDIIAKAWQACHEGKLAFTVSAIDSEGSAVVKVNINNPATGGYAKIIRVHTIGCTQEAQQEGWLPFLRNLPLRPNVEFDRSGQSATFNKKEGHSSPIVIIQSSIGIGFVPLKPWPPLDLPPIPAKITATATDPNSVLLSWESVAPKQTVVDYVVMKNGSEIAVVRDVNWHDSNCTPNTTYAYSVYSRTIAGQSQSPASTTVRTPPAPRSAPRPRPRAFMEFSDLRDTERFHPNFLINPPQGARNIRVQITGSGADSVTLNLREDRRGLFGARDRNIFTNLRNGSVFPAARYSGVFWQVRGVTARRGVRVELFWVPDPR